MQWSKKIDNRKYITGTAIVCFLAVVSAQLNFWDSLLLLAVVVCSCMNQWLMFVILGKFFQKMSETKDQMTVFQKMVLWAQVSLKFLLIGAIFFVITKTARHLAPQALVVYTFQLIILILSIKNIDAFFKKGPLE